MSRRILAVVPGGRAGVGGMCRMAAAMAAEWQARGRAPPMRVLDSHGGRRGRMPLVFAATLARVAALLLGRRVAVLHLHCAERGSVLRKGLLLLLGKACGVPVVLHMHGAEFPQFFAALPPPARAVLRAVLARADAVVVLGAEWRRFFITVVGLAAARVHVIANGVALPPAPIEPPAGEPCRLLFAGNLGPRKNLAGLLAALADPRLAALDWTLDIAGDGDAEAHRAAAAATGIAARLRFHGWLGPTPMAALLARAAVLVLPSRDEGLPMAILEAMAQGLAVVATPVGAIPEAVRDGETGLLVPPGDDARLAGALCRLVADPALRRRLGAAGRAAIAREFSLGRQNDRLAALFAALADPSTPPHPAALAEENPG